jgi:hypothetical protein
VEKEMMKKVCTLLQCMNVVGSNLGLYARSLRRRRRRRRESLSFGVLVTIGF